MRILVYGAGVLGCELAHVLLQNKKNDVTLLARGEWKERIDQKGLVIRQWAQRKTTVDRVRTIDVLAPEDFYDLVFVVLQAGQLPDVLPVLKANRSPYFVFVGNDPHAKQVLEAMQRPADKVAFGFQNTAGRRERDRVVSVHTGVGMTVGGATAPLSGTFRIRLKTAFDGTKYKLTFYSDMDEWLKCHIAFILPVCYVCYACNGDLTRASKQQRAAILDAAYEGCEMLKACLLYTSPSPRLQHPAEMILPAQSPAKAPGSHDREPGALLCLSGKKIMPDPTVPPGLPAPPQWRCHPGRPRCRRFPSGPAVP